MDLANLSGQGPKKLRLFVAQLLDVIDLGFEAIHSTIHFAEALLDSLKSGANIATCGL